METISAVFGLRGLSARNEGEGGDLWIVLFWLRDQFDGDLAYLNGNYEAAAVAEFSAEARPVPRRPGALLVTFDDGYAEWATVVGPQLERAGLRGIFFVTSDVIDNQSMLCPNKVSLALAALARTAPDEREPLLSRARPLLALPVDAPLGQVVAAMHKLYAAHDLARTDRLLHSWGVSVSAYLETQAPFLTAAQIQDMARRGHVIGAHGIDHRNLNVADPEELQRQVVSSCERIAAITGQRRVPFSFPYSMRLPVATLETLRSRHPVIGCMFGTAGIKPSPPGFVARIGADWRHGIRHGSSNAGVLISNAYYVQARRALRGALRGADIPAPS